MLRYLPIGLTVVLIVGSAFLQGIESERWTDFPELSLFAKELPRVPTQVGEWKSTPLPEPNQKTLDQAGAVGSVSRNYLNDRNESVQVFIVCGRVLDMFHHNPDRCYRAAGFESDEEPTKIRVDLDNGEGADFLTSRFTKTDVSGSQDVRIYWSFSATGAWEAPSEHKWSFAGQHALYKIYVIVPAKQEQSIEQNPATEFIRVFFPEMTKVFQPATGTPPATAKPTASEPSAADSAAPEPPA